VIEAAGVAYDYAAMRALHGVSFTVEPGAVLALVGPNGAGKTTLMRCIAALDAPTEGTITVAGVDTRADPRAVHAAIGYLPDFFGLYDELSVRRALTYAALSRGVAKAAAPSAVERAAARVRLSDRLEARAGELSRGLRQRLAIGQTIVHEPRVLLLDEPAAGLDPEARRELSDLIVRLAAEGMTIVVSSHILSELEDYSTRMLMIRDGRVAAGGVVAAGAGSAQAAERFAVTLDEAPADLAERLAALGAGLVSADGGEAVISGPPGMDAPDVLARLIASGLRVRAFQPARRTLEAAYLEELAR